MISKTVVWLIGTLIVIAGLGCSRFRMADPGLEIDITKAGAEYLFTFRTCKGQRVEIPWIHVSRRDGGAKVGGTTQCEIAVADASVTGISNGWRYGETPPGYVVKKCDPLKAGASYEIQAAGAAGGDRVFTLRQDGELKLGPSSCVKH